MYLSIFRIFCLFILLLVQVQQKGCADDDVVYIKKRDKVEPDIYDEILVDLPYSRTLYKEKGIKLRKTLKVSTIDLPAQSESVVRWDHFDKNGRLKKTVFRSEDSSLDSVKYQYFTNDLIAKIRRFYADGNTTVTSMFYDKDSYVIQQISEETETLTLFDVYQDGTGRMVDKQLSEDSPSYSGERMIYKYNAIGELKEILQFVNKVPRAKEDRAYDRQKRMKRKEHLINGRVVEAYDYVYNPEGFLAIQKEEMVFNSTEKERQVYEFIYEYH